MLKIVFFICIFFSARDIFITHDFSILGNTIGITYLYDFLKLLALYFLPFIFMYLFLTINIKEIQIKKYINYIGVNFLLLHSLYANKEYNYDGYKEENKKNYIIFIIGIIVFFILSYFNHNITINISINIALTLLLSLFKNKTPMISKKEALKDFYEKYIQTYELIKETELTFGKHKGKKFSEIPEEYVDWLASEKFTPSKNQHNMDIAKKYSEYKLSKPLLEEKIKYLLEYEDVNSKIEINIELKDILL